MPSLTRLTWCPWSITLALERLVSVHAQWSRHHRRRIPLSGDLNFVDSVALSGSLGSIAISREPVLCELSLRPRAEAPIPVFLRWNRGQVSRVSDRYILVGIDEAVAIVGFR